MAVSYVLVAVAVAQLGDLLTFLRMVSLHGTAAEANPVVEHAATEVGLPVLAVAKLAVIILAVATFAVLARSHRRMAAVVATVGTFAGLLGAATNLLAML